MASGNRLSASDLSSLHAEDGPIHVHVGATILVEGSAPSYDNLVAHVENRLDMVPRLRQRVTPTPMGLDNPVWADYEEFDVTRHVRHVGAPRPGRLEQLRDLVGRIMSEPLDMEHPLWQLYLVDGLPGGRHAFVSKTHHAMVDGVAAVDVGMLLLDPTREGTQLALPKKRELHQPSPAELLLQAASGRVQRGIATARRGVRSVVETPGGTAGSMLKTAEAFTALAAGGPSCPKTFINERVGRDRRLGWVRTDLERLKKARGDSGATVNDIFLSVATGALRRFFTERGEEVPEYVVALVPVSIRREEEQGELGNRISTILVKLPLGEPDARERLELIRSQTAKLKQSENARAASLIINAAGIVPPILSKRLSQAMARPLVFNLVVSNVPGPPQPLYLLGNEIREIYPFVPLSPQNHALTIGAISYNGKVFFGLAGDRDLLPDLDGLSGAIREALKEVSAAGRRKAPAKAAADDEAEKKPGKRPAKKPKASPKAKAPAKAKAKAKTQAKTKRPARRPTRG